MNTVTRFLTLVFTVAAVSFSGLLWAENIYRWVDSNGVTTYGDKPQIGSEPIRVRNGKAVTPKEAPGNAPAANDEETLAEIRKNQCEIARKRYSQFSASNRITETDEFGKKRELDAEERLTTIAKAKGDVETYCGEPEG